MSFRWGLGLFALLLGALVLIAPASHARPRPTESSRAEADDPSDGAGNGSHLGWGLRIAEAGGEEDPVGALQMLGLANRDRAAAGLAPLTPRQDVADIAIAHSHAMAIAGDIWHNDAYFTADTKRRLDALTVGENVALNTSVEDAHNRLMNSPGHRANLMNPKFSVVGIGVVRALSGRNYITQNFVEPRPASPPPPPSAPSVPAPPPPAPPPTTVPPGPAVPAVTVPPGDPGPDPDPAPDEPAGPADGAASPVPAPAGSPSDEAGLDGPAGRGGRVGTALGAVGAAVSKVIGGVAGTVAGATGAAVGAISAALGGRSGGGSAAPATAVALLLLAGVASAVVRSRGRFTA